MKTPRDVRHRKRVQIIRSLFAWQFQAKNGSDTKEAKQVIEHLEKIDTEVEKAAPEWPIKQINRIDLAILRLAVFELIIVKEVPFKVIVDEAVELAKEFGAESSPSFINGVLGKIITAHKLDQNTKKII